MRKLILRIIGCTLLASQSLVGLSADGPASPFDNLTPGVWTLIGPGDADQVTSLNVTNDGTILLGSDIGGIYQSIDQGDTWFPSNDSLNNYDITTAIIISPTNPNTRFVGTRGGFYKSRDGVVV